MSFLNELIERLGAVSKAFVNLGICEVCLLISLLTDWKKNGNQCKKYRPILVYFIRKVLDSQRSLSHAVSRLVTDSLVLLMNALKRKGRVWVGKKYIQDQTWWLAKQRTLEEGISSAVFILQRFARSIEWHYLFRLISFYTWEVRPLWIESYLNRQKHFLLRSFI